MAAGLAVLDIIEEDGLQENARVVGGRLKAGLRELQTRHRLIGDVRGMGLMLGAELVRDRETKEPATQETLAVWEAMREMGVLVGKGGLFGNTLRIKPPMCITAADVDFTLEVLDAALERVEAIAERKDGERRRGRRGRRSSEDGIVSARAADRSVIPSEARDLPGNGPSHSEQGPRSLRSLGMTLPSRSVALRPSALSALSALSAFSALSASPLFALSVLSSKTRSPSAPAPAASGSAAHPGPRSGVPGSLRPPTRTAAAPADTGNGFFLTSDNSSSSLGRSSAMWARIRPASRVVPRPWPV